MAIALTKWTLARACHKCGHDVPTIIYEYESYDFKLTEGCKCPKCRATWSTQFNVMLVDRENYEPGEWDWEETEVK